MKSLKTLAQATGFSRRQLLQALGGGLALGAARMPRVWAQASPQHAKRLGQGRLVVVFLRGAYDGLSAFVPYADTDYYKLRPNIAIPTPDGSAQTALKLDNTFALHPVLSPLLPLWQQGVLSFVPAAGLPAPNRSHFDAQYQMEIAQSGKTSAAPGWLNKVAALDANTTAALGVGEANPAILAGAARVKLIPRGQAAERTGVLANDKTRQALMDLYAGNDKISEAFRQGAGSRMQSAQELTTEKVAMDGKREMTARENTRRMDRNLDKDGTPANMQAQNAQMLAASNGAADPVGLQLDAQHLGTLMRSDRNLAIGFLSAGGWDTHANQGNATGQLANNLGNLGRGMAQLRQDFSEPGDVIVVMSEFGRTSAENGTRGTDHGFGNAMWLIGNRVNGGHWHGEWTGLARANLNEARDLPAHHDYRAVLAQVLRATFALPDSALSTLLPGSSWDARLDGLMRAA
ncbi:MAG: DUF1501 domain-containing protein [Polaromonas sp.]|nr:DUF1501 domain-containing protein [Polaromonas sp.]